MKNIRSDGITKITKTEDRASPPRMMLPSPRYISDPGPGEMTRGSISNNARAEETHITNLFKTIYLHKKITIYHPGILYLMRKCRNLFILREA